MALSTRYSSLSPVFIVVRVAGGALLGRTLEGAVLVALHAQRLGVFPLQRVPHPDRIPHHRDRSCKIVAHAALRAAVGDMVGWRRPVLSCRIVTNQAVLYGYHVVRNAGPYHHLGHRRC